MSVEEAYHAWSYEQSRSRFREACASAGWRHEQVAIEARDVRGGELTIDAATSVNPGATRTVLVTSGLHGVEAPFGAAVQLRMLEASQALAERHPDVRFVLLHALNPFGYAYSRRVNEDNVDLNRNFLLHGEAYAGSPPGYKALDGLLNPKSPPRGIDLFYLRAAAAVVRQGMPALKQAIAGGQYDYPRGLFFGGHGPSQTQQALRSFLPRLLDGSERVMHVDFHTGLGRWGTYKLLTDHASLSCEEATLRAAFGDEAVQLNRSDGVAYAARGSLGPWCRQLLSDVDYAYVCAEFGTYPPLRVVAGLRRENQGTQTLGSDDPRTRAAREELRRLFVPPSADWWNTVLPAGHAIVEQAAGMVCRKA